MAGREGGRGLGVGGRMEEQGGKEQGGGGRSKEESGQVPQPHSLKLVGQNDGKG